MYKCMICGKEMKAVSWKHLHFKHGLTVAEYEAMGYKTGIGSKLKGRSNLALKGREFPGRKNSGQFRNGTDPWNKGEKMTQGYGENISEAMYNTPGAIRYGPDSTSWKGGISVKAEWWRRSVLERDNYTCQLCGRRADDDDMRIHTHHIKPKSTHPELDFDIDHGVTLFNSCHATVHQRPGFDLIEELDKRRGQS